MVAANARRAIAAAGRRKGPAGTVVRKPRAPTYGYDTLKVLIEVWTLIGEPCGKYLAPIMASTLVQLEAFGELDKVAARITETVREQLVAMSPATIDRMLRPTKKARYPAAKSATRPGATLRSSIVVRQAMDAMEQAPGFFEIDLVAHCGHTLKGEHAWTLTMTDVYLGWTENVAIRNRAHSPHHRQRGVRPMGRASAEPVVLVLAPAEQRIRPLAGVPIVVVERLAQPRGVDADPLRQLLDGTADCEVAVPPVAQPRHGPRFRVADAVTVHCVGVADEKGDVIRLARIGVD